MTSMRKFIDLLETAHEQPLDEATLYRGDPENIETFDIDRTGDGGLFGQGLYLTDDPRVAEDYTITSREHYVFKSDDAETPRDVVAQYLRHIMKTDLGMDEKIGEIAARLKPEYLARLQGKHHSEDPELFRKTDQEYRDAVEAERHKLIKSLLKQAKEIYKKNRPNLRITRDTLGGYKIVKADREGYVTQFEIPDEYLAKCLHGDEPLPDMVLTAIKELFLNGRPEDTTFDMRDANGKFQTFDGWVEAYKTIGIDYAWADGIHGGKGKNPNLDEIRNGTHFGYSWFNDKDNAKKFITAMNRLGYVGLMFNGGTPSHGGDRPRGGGGHEHTVYVFWDADSVYKFRRQSVPVRDREIDANLEKGLRTSRILYRG